MIAASAGNHAQALAYHGTKMNIPVTIVMPTISPQVKQEQTCSFGAEVIIEGEDLVKVSEQINKFAIYKVYCFLLVKRLCYESWKRKRIKIY